MSRSPILSAIVAMMLRSQPNCSLTFTTLFDVDDKTFGVYIVDIKLDAIIKGKR